MTNTALITSTDTDVAAENFNRVTGSLNEEIVDTERDILRKIGQLRRDMDYIEQAVLKGQHGGNLAANRVNDLNEMLAKRDALVDVARKMDYLVRKAAAE